MNYIAPQQGGGAPVRVPAAAFFEDAYQRVEPFFETKHSWTGVPMEFFAFRVLREAYPSLPSIDLHELVVASARVFRRRHGSGLAS
jgi:hypothetical protein